MDEPFFEGIRSLERQAFVRYVTVADQNGYSIAASGEANKSTASAVREIENCVEELFKGAENVKVVIEGASKSVVIGHDGPFLFGIQVNKNLF